MPTTCHSAKRSRFPTRVLGAMESSSTRWCSLAEVNSLIRLTSGELEITETLAIDALTASDVTITGDANGDDVTDAANVTNVAASSGGMAGTSDDLLDDNSRIFNFSSDEGDLALLGITVTGGRTTDSLTDGGGIQFNSDGLLALASSNVSGNSSVGIASDGGGIHARLGDVTLINSIVSENTTTGDGGGIQAGTGSVTVNNSTVSGNSSAGEGGGISAGFGSVTLNSSDVSGNSTEGTFSDGGGITARSGDVAINSSTITGNSTLGSSSDGGGIQATFGSVTLTNSTVSGNSTAGSRSDGGGISASFGSLALINSTVSGNSTNVESSLGGGIYLGRGAVVLVGSTVTGNSSAGEGGGIAVDDKFEDPSITIANSIVAGNLHNQTTNTPGTPNDLVLDPDSELTINYSLIGVADNITQPITGNVGNQFGSVTSPLDPLLGPLADNGGPTQTHALLLGSPAIDAGSNALAVDEDGNPLLNDQRGFGFDRVLASSVDIGAFEFDPSGLPDAPTVLSTVRDEGGVLARPDLLTTFSVNFDADVDVEATDLSVVNESLGGVTVDLSSVTFSYDSSIQTATWDFSALTLDPSFYLFELSDDIVLADANVGLDGDNDGFLGGNFVESVYVALPGDANLDGQVDVLDDAFSLVANLGTTGGATWAQGDFNGDGNVDVLGDAFILIAHLGQSVIPPVTAELARNSVSPTLLAGSLTIDAAFEDEDLLEEMLLG